MSDEGVKYTYRRPAPERPDVDWSALAAYAVSRRHGHPPETALVGTGGSGPVGAADAVLRELAPERLAEAERERVISAVVRMARDLADHDAEQMHRWRSSASALRELAELLKDGAFAPYLETPG